MSLILRLYIVLASARRRVPCLATEGTYAGGEFLLQDNGRWPPGA